MEIKIQKLYEDAEIPTYGSALSAGMKILAISNLPQI